ncbi:glycosyltransferase [Lihuaxuella thermophila]|uniref:Glycosyltransferase, catalytic subunit of cellulose synthase and poly-beta-1,6-N-acetylglucosamine synthase n=1 Tax=Lihuaxuella thermophila TaxID=1173111 RepID=A0A1H8CIB1_9BACL|nr:glycosyltransferase [Lihuaxuella thermophila]SEM94164.1 Glycosyltransferase, catalytic subunit of cellulose synthase and poly-beta-1,6-N-acetylglucosamine synthase [Lihuaxuella thermophila]
MRRKIANLIFSVFFLGSYQRRAVGGTLGVLLGILPIGHTAWIVGLILCLIFRLNLLAVYVGISVSLLFPLIVVAAHWSGMDRFFSSPDSTALYVIAGILFLFLCYLAFRWIYKDVHIRDLTNGEKMFVFHDLGKRWTFLKRILLILGVLSLITLTVFGISLYDHPVVTPLVQKTPSDPSIQPIPAGLDHSKKTAPAFPETDSREQPKDLTTYAFYVPWDSKGWFDLNSLGHIKDIDVLIPEWYSLQSDLTLDISRQENVDQLAKKHHVQIIPRLNNFTEQKWDGSAVSRMLASPQKRASLIHELHQDVKKHGYAGINIYFEKVRPQDKKRLTAFIKELSTVFHRDGLKVIHSVPVDDPAYDYRALSNYADYLDVILYEEHHEEGAPGPIASFNWTKKSLERLPVPAGKRIISLGTYGYDWAVGSRKPAKALTFNQVMMLADRYQLKVEWDAASSNPYLRYKKGSEEHIVWFLDAPAFYNQLRLVHQYGAEGIAFWRLGSEDKAIWDLLKGKPDAVSGMRQVTSPIPEYIGDGEILSVSAIEKQGSRSVELEEGNWIKDVGYQSPSAPLQVQRYGKTAEKKIALTFDDGPDSAYTAQILDILKKHNIKASFYITGENAVLHPGLVERMYEEGHEVGNHTYSHPHLGQISPFLVRLELHSTQRLFQAFTDHTLTTFRPPYQVESEPQTRDEIRAMVRGSQYGYTMISKNIETFDWQKPSSRQITERIMEQLKLGHIVLLHDAGGDRSETVKALPELIEKLKAQGYQFVTASELIGKSKDQVMPAIQPEERIYLPFAKAVFTVTGLLQHSFTFLIYTGIGIGFVRVAFLMYFSFRQRIKFKRRVRWLDRGAQLLGFNPMVSVVIAAYNEEKVINKTIHSVLQSKYAPLEVIIVNDGSTDQTEAVIKREFAGNPQVRVITQPNSGKTAAINRGYRLARGEIIVSIDADTLIADHTIPLLVRHFQDEKVAAVSGNVKVGNVRNLLTLWQHVEYITGFNLERRAFDDLNCIPVVPGAICAWRKSAVEEVGYFKHDTLAEDTDITITLLRHGYKVEFEVLAFAYTEAPEDLKSLIKQRTRWIYGTLQCLWKHRGALFSRKQKALGFVSLPNMWIFQYGVQTFSLFVDLLCILSLFTDHAVTTMTFYIGFLMFDLLAAYFAFRLEKESPKPLIWLFIQRFVYRQLMSYVVVRSFIFAFKGISVGWNKLKRKGHVQLEQGDPLKEVG